MIISDINCKDLGFDTIRNWLVDHCHSTTNSTYFLSLLPQSNIENLTEAYQYTGEILAGFQRKDSLPIDPIPEIDTSLDALGIRGSRLSPEEFKTLYQILTLTHQIRNSFNGNPFVRWQLLIEDIDGLQSGVKKIESIFDDQFNIRYDASPELQSIIKKIDRMSSKIQDRMQSIFSKSKQENWLQENHIALRNGRNVLPIKAASKRKIKGIMQDQSATGQTVYIEPLEIIELNNDLSQLYFDKREEINRILMALTTWFQPHKDTLINHHRFLVYYDRHYTIAEMAILLDAIPANLSWAQDIELELARNPLLIMGGKDVVPLQMSVDKENRILLISGPNAGGKTVVLKTLGLFSLMAQSGLFIPAKKATLPLVTQILCDIGDRQSIEDDLSTFTAHIQNLAHIIKKADENSLVLLDELGTGTDPDAGAAISQGILETILQQGSRLLATTHLGALKSWAHDTDAVMNCGMVFDSNALKPTYEIQLGLPGASYAIEISNRHGLDPEIIERAKSLIGDNSIQLEAILRSLETEKQRSEELSKDLSDREQMIIDRERVIKYREQEIKNIHRSAKSDASEKAEYLVHQTRKEMENLVADIRTSHADSGSIQQAKEKIGKKLTTLKKQGRPLQKTTDFDQLKKSDAILGQLIFIPRMDLDGVIIHPPNNQNKITVEANGLKLTLKLNEVSLRSRQPEEKVGRRLSINTIQRPESMRLDLRGKRVDAALGELEQFLDRALLSGMYQVSILHGKGTGALMEAVQTYLKEQSFIDSYEFASEEYGGAGITEVILK